MMSRHADTARLPPVASTGLPDSGRSTAEALFAAAPDAPPGSAAPIAARGVPAGAGVRSRPTRVSRALLAAAAAAMAAGCASHLTRPAPAPAAAVAGRCGVEPGVCLLGVPAPLDEGGEASGWRCLGLHGGADAACPLPEAPPSADAPRPPTRPGLLRPAGAPRVAAAEPARRPAAAAQDAPARAAAVSPRARAEIAALLAAKARRTPAQRKVSSHLLDAAARARQATADGGGFPLAPRVAAPDGRAPEAGAVADERAPVDVGAGLGVGAGVAGAPGPVDAGAAEDGRAPVDIRAEVTPEVLARIRALGGTVVNSVPRYRSIRARLPLAAVEALAEMDAVRSIRPADEAVTHQAPGLRSVDRRAPASAVRSKVNTSEGDVAHRADQARLTYGIDGTGIGIGVLSNGVDGLARRQRTGDLPDRVTVLAGQAGEGSEGTAMLEIVHDLAPGADLYYATALGSQARYAANIEALCAAGADVIVDDIFYWREGVFQDDLIAQGINAAVADGCFYFSAAGNAGNLNDGTSGVWEGDYAAGGALTVNGVAGVVHDFGGVLHENRITKDPGGIVLQWADPLEASTNDYDLFLIDGGGNVIAASTTTQSGSQDPIEYIPGSRYRPGARLVVVKVSGADRYLRVSAIRGELEIATAGNTFGHSAAANAIGVAAVDARTADAVFDGSESVRTFSSDGPRRMFFQPDGTPITADDFSSTGGTVLQKPDLAAADGVSTATPGFRTFSGTSAAAPHAAALAALLLEAAGGAGRMTLGELRAAMAGSALDIEAEGVDRDSGAGIVMAPDAVDAVAVGPAGRNRSPTATGTLDDRTLAPGAGAVTIDLATRFADPDADTLTYTAVSSRPDRAVVALTGSLLRLTPVAPSRAVVTVRVIDPDGLGAVLSFSATVAAGDRDYDLDDDGLIEVAILAQLDAVRYDLDGDGEVGLADWTRYDAAFPEAAAAMGCPPIERRRPGRPPRIGCRGYELTADLDFDTDGSGGAGAGDTYWNGGSGWAPIGALIGGWEIIWRKPFAADFEGNGHTIANLFIHRPAEDGIGLFGHVFARIRNLGLVDVDVTGRDHVGSLAGVAQGSYLGRSHATGRVSGHSEVGGLSGGGNPFIRYSWAAVRVSGTGDRIGGLAGNANYIWSSHASGRVSGAHLVGGLVGHSSREIRSSHAAGRVSGRGIPGSDRLCWDLQGGVGGLAGQACGTVRASYATGAVSGEEAVGGLIGSTGSSLRARRSYWDLDTSGVRVGIGSHDKDGNGRIDGTEPRSVGVSGLTTAALQAPTGYDGIYETWNLNTDGNGAPDDPWRFGTATQYPVLAADLDGDGQATWEEFGYQLREGPALTAATSDGGAPVVLTWTAVDASHWSPAPDVTYTLTRGDDGAAVATLAEGLRGLRYTDAAVDGGAAYIYQVEAVGAGGGAARSAPVSVTMPGNRSPMAVGALADRTLRARDAETVEVTAAFRDPDGDALTYGAGSSAPAVATVGVSGARLTIAPMGEGRTTVTVTATDVGGSNTSAMQRFAVTVLPGTAVDHDTDDDGLIEIWTLAQLDAVRHDPDGDGAPTAPGAARYAAAFPDRVVCGGAGCAGYELRADLDFDTDGDGRVGAGDAYWNGGAGWTPIGQSGGYFAAIFEGNGHGISNLFVDRGYHAGLFSWAARSSVIRHVRLIDVDVRGRTAGGLVGTNHGAVAGCHVTGRVSGTSKFASVGGLVGHNEGVVTRSYARVRVSGSGGPSYYGTGGLVGHSSRVISDSYATGRVSGHSDVGGLVGINAGGDLTGSYATGRVSGNSAVGGLVGSNGGAIKGSYATGRVSGNSAVGGLVGDARFSGQVRGNYATGRVSGDSDVGGLIGLFGRGYLEAIYWDTTTSGHTGLTVGQGGQSVGQGQTTAALQAPTDYSGIYRHWNLDLDGDGPGDDPWDFGTGAQYPALSADMDGDGHATWEEFGYQLRSGPALTATETVGRNQVALSWPAVDAGHWDPPPEVTYTVTRDDGATVTVIAEAVAGLGATDTGVVPGGAYTYQVSAVVDGGAVTHSAPKRVIVAGNWPPVTVGTLAERTLRAEDGSVDVDVAAAFSDPENDVLIYGAVSSAPAVAGVSTSGTTVRVTPRTAGTATVTVTATDAVGSGGTATLSFTVTVANGSPVAVGALGALTLRIADGAAAVDVSGAFLDPDGDPLTYGASTSAPGVATVEMALVGAAGAREPSGSTLTLTPLSPGETRVTVTATDEVGSGGTATQSFVVTVPEAPVDYDGDGDGLIEIVTLAQLDAVRHDLDGDGVPAGLGTPAGPGAAPPGASAGPGAAAHAAAFPEAAERMGCPAPACLGYELVADLDFDTDGSGKADAGDAFWNGGAGWRPLGTFDEPFTGVFSGNGRTVSHLFVRGGDNAGLFGMSRGVIRGVGVVAADVTGSRCAGALAGLNGGRVEASWSTGAVTGESCVGGLVGVNGLWVPHGGTFRPLEGFVTASWSAADATAEQWVGGLVGYNNGTVVASYATGAVTATTDGSGAGGLVGRMGFGANRITASYATGAVSGRGGAVGGLVGHAMPHDRVTASYWDTETSGVTRGGGGAGRTTAALQAPTGYTGPYAAWDVDEDGDGSPDAPWDFGTPGAYPALSVDVDGDGAATGQELGLQGRAAPPPGTASEAGAPGGATARAQAAPATFTDDPLVPGVTPVRAVHLLELRARIDGLRRRAGLPAFGWTDAQVVPGATPARAAHLLELRAALGEAYAASARPAPGYTDAVVTAGSTAMRALQLQELRRAVLALEVAPAGAEP